MRASRILHAQRLVEGADFDAQADAEARTHALVQRLEVVGRPVGRDDDLPPGVEQRIQRMSEFRLDGLALQELRIVENQEIDRSQTLLEGDRGLRLKGGDEAVHELLGRQIDRRAALGGRCVRNRLQKVGLAEADRRMDEQRAERRGGAAEALGEAFGGRVSELIGAPDLEGREGQPAIERRADERVRRGGRRGMGRCAARARRRPPFGAGSKRHGPGRRRHRTDRRSGRLGIRTNRRPDHDQDAGERSEFGGERGRDRTLVMRVDPALEEARRHGEARLAAGDGLELDPSEPAVENVVAELGAQPLAATPPGLRRAAGLRRRWPRRKRRGFHDEGPWTELERRKGKGSSAERLSFKAAYDG